jgi:hypothetical protein
LTRLLVIALLAENRQRERGDRDPGDTGNHPHENTSACGEALWVYVKAAAGFSDVEFSPP